MQEQNFEKQVRQKMEELSFTPSEPVWKKVEEEIRRKKGRRRLLFWLPFAFLLVGGGIWMTRTTSITKSNLSETTGHVDNKNHKHQSIEIKLSKEKKIAATKLQEQTTTPVLKHQGENHIYANSKRKFTNPKTLISATIDFSKRKTLSPTPMSPAPESALEPGEKALKKKDIWTEAESEQFPVQQDTDVAAIEVLTTTIQTPDTSLNNKAPIANEIGTDTVQKINVENKILTVDSSTVNKVAKAKSKNVSKWRFALAGGIGRSGIDEGLNLFGGGGAKALTADQNPGSLNSPIISYRPPSVQKKSPAFFFAFLVKKKISKRLDFSSGLQYNSYSTEMLVGQNIQSNFAINQSLRVPQFYSNTGTSLNTYYNTFHFICLPVGVDFQLFQKIPFDIHVGLSMQQLLHTNALLYSSSSGIYYNDNDAFNHTQLFSNFGINYSLPFRKQWSFKLGPNISYGHSRMAKNSSSQHLFSYGVEAQFVFGRK